MVNYGKGQCVVCSTVFEKRNNRQLCCSDLCSRKRRTDQQLARSKERRINDPDWAEKQRQWKRDRWSRMTQAERKAHNESNQRLYQDNPEYRKQVLARNRQRWASDPKLRKRSADRKRQRYNDDPQYRQQVREKDKQRSSGRGYANGRLYSWFQLKGYVLIANPICQSCCSQDSTQVDHIVALGLGGTHDLVNLQALCGDCHRAKSVSDLRKVRGVNSSG